MFTDAESLKRFYAPQEYAAWEMKIRDVISMCDEYGDVGFFINPGKEELTVTKEFFGQILGSPQDLSVSLKSVLIILLGTFILIGGFIWIYFNVN